MYRKIFAIWLGSMLCVSYLSACDICGCSIPHSNMGLLTNLHRNSLGCRFSNTSFEVAALSGSKIKDRFQAYELNGAYYFHNKLRFYADVSYQNNQRIESDQKNSIHGIGDLKAGLAYELVNRELFNDSYKFYFEIASQIKIPIGKYNANLHDLNLPENFNLSNGAWGIGLNPRCAFSNAINGLVINANYILQSNSKYGYKFGNPFQFQTLYYYETTISEQFKIIPFAGYYFEHIGADHHKNKRKVEGTGGQGHFIDVGMNLNYTNFLLSFSNAFALDQKYSGGTAKLGSKYSVQLTYLF
ncbi:MAG TPA: hypothetical protein PLS73_10405 [Saprospiraceae bacterium]|nr:hypothetical protein [Saprospiraceae bacterium]